MRMTTIIMFTTTVMRMTMRTIHMSTHHPVATNIPVL